jgi:3-hydroxyacyl-CoA dehydrogenase/enoyl-CoA hydratase/3-hydroxybutyryl-CoA epimerase
LGIIPGFGGTQRLPRLVGLQEGVKMILSGKAVDARKAFKIGLVDDLSQEEFLEERLGIFISEILQKGAQNQYLELRKQVQKKRRLFEFLTKHLVFPLAKKDLMEKTKGNYPAPFSALEVVKKTYAKSNQSKGLEIELEAFCKLAVGEISKNLIEIFFTSEALKKDSGIETKEEIAEIHILFFTKRPPPAKSLRVYTRQACPCPKTPPSKKSS